MLQHKLFWPNIENLHHWQHCGQLGDLSSTLWDCSKMERYWEDGIFSAEWHISHSKSNLCNQNVFFLMTLNILQTVCLHQALIDEDRLLSRLEVMGNQLQAYSKVHSVHSCKTGSFPANGLKSSLNIFTRLSPRRRKEFVRSSWLFRKTNTTMRRHRRTYCGN